MNKKISCIGSGNIGSILMKSAARIMDPKNIGFTDMDKPKAKAVADSLGSTLYESNIEAAKNGDYIFLAVKPQVLTAVLGEIAPVIRERIGSGKKSGKNITPNKNAPVLVSMAPGWTIEKIQSIVAANVPVARIMPNTPSFVSKGLIAMNISPQVSGENKSDLEAILGASGIVEYIEEKNFDAITGLSGSGPAFVYIFLEALADGGVRAGLSRDKALIYACQTVMGSAAMVLETGKHLSELKDMVTSPGGTTIAGISVLEKGAFRGTVMGAVEAAWQRAMELG